MCQICDNEYEGLTELKIKNCSNIIEIPNIQGLNTLEIYECSNITKILNIQGLNELYIENCNKLSEIPNIQGLTELDISNCKYLNDISSSDKLDVKRYLLGSEIKNWLKRMLFLRSKRFNVLWKIAEFYTIKKFSPKNVLKYITLDD